MKKKILFFTMALLCISIEITHAGVQGALPGAFSVSATKKVYFSQGNLQYQVSTNTWRFAANQYTIGTDFLWGTGNNPTLNECCVSEYVEWGVNKITNGGNQTNIWRTLSKTEWTYIMTGRANAAQLVSKGTVNNVHGLIMLPDNWSLPSGLTFIAGKTTDGWDVNDYSISDWQKMEQNGAIFLPVNVMNGQFYTSSNMFFYTDLGLYWTSSPGTYSPNGSGMVFHRRSAYMQEDHGSRKNVKNVRLVIDSDKNTSYTITWKNWDGTTLATTSVLKGATPSYTGATPTRPSTAQYTYSFCGWSPEIVAVTDEATYTAQFTSTLNKYAIAFVNYDGAELQNSEVEYGETPVYTGVIPTKPADAQYTYSFSGWDAELVAVTGEATYTAQFTSTLNKYAITFVNYDGTELQSSEVAYGETPVYTGETPIKPADAQYTYSFSGWDAELEAVTGEATYTAQFTSTLNKYAITFLNYDGSELQNSEVAYGETPVYTGATPAKPADAQYTYSFSGWDAELVAVIGEATYTAQFTSTLNKYAITFLNYDGSELQSSELEAGTMPQYNGATPTRPADAQYTYTFAGWDKKVVAVTGDATYTAVFESVVRCGTIETTDGITVWEDQLPYTWEGISFTTAGTETKTLQASDGCDSIVTFSLRVLYRNITLQENESADYYTQFANDYNGQRVNTATLNRQFTQGKWATLCLPFNVSKGMMMALGLNARVYEFRYAETVDNLTVIYFAVAQSIEAGKGYIVNANAKLAAKTSFVFPSVTINTDADNADITALTGYNDGSVRGSIYLVGTLRTGKLQGTTNGNIYLGLKDNMLYYPNTVTGTNIRAYRGFFRSEVPLNAQRIRIVAEGVDNEELEIVNGELQENRYIQDIRDVRKYIDNGILYIYRNGIRYTAQGQRLD